MGLVGVAWGLAVGLVGVMTIYRMMVITLLRWRLVEVGAGVGVHAAALEVVLDLPGTARTVSSQRHS